MFRSRYAAGVLWDRQTWLGVLTMHFSRPACSSISCTSFGIPPGKRSLAMNKRNWIVSGAAVAVVAAVALGAVLWAGRWTQPAIAAVPAAVQPAPVLQEPEVNAAAGEAYIQSYAAKFVCTEPLQAGAIFNGPVAPLVRQKTDVLVHNPTGFPVTFFKKAVIAPVEKFGELNQGVDPGKYYRVTLQPDRSFRIDCDDIAKLLTGDAKATFLSAYGIGVTVEGFVVVLIGPQQSTAGTVTRYAPLDVTSEYVRSSEFLKKDINYQPWWWYWPAASIPWRLGYAYQRVLPLSVDAQQANIDCRGALISALQGDVDRVMGTGQGAQQTHAGLEAGSKLDPTTIPQQSEVGDPALVPLIGRCDKISLGGALGMSVDYVLVSNVSPNGGYPWLPGHWYDLAMVVPQNKDIDLDKLMRDWQSQRWIDAGTPAADVSSAMAYYFPYWCGWGYWWWWNTTDCIDIGVGDGESLDVEQVTPVRVLMPNWPPATNP
jgi:hypothetical protein